MEYILNIQNVLHHIFYYKNLHNLTVEDVCYLLMIDDVNIINIAKRKDKYLKFIHNSYNNINKIKQNIPKNT